MKDFRTASGQSAEQSAAAVFYDPFTPLPYRGGKAEASPAGAVRESQYARRSEIFAAIRRLIAKVGCEHVTVRRIAEDSGYAVQTIYNLVGPRDQAISDAISEYSIFVGRRASAALEAAEALPAIVNNWLQAISKTPEFVRQSNLVYFTDSRGIYYRFRDRQLSGMYTLLKRQKNSGIIKPEVDIRSLAEQLGLFASTMCLEWSDRPFPIERLHQKICSGFTSLLADKMTSSHATALYDWLATTKNGTANFTNLPACPSHKLIAN